MFFDSGFFGGGLPGGGRGGRRGGAQANTTKLYEVLGVSKTASADELKKAYKKLAIRHHPDKGGDADKFKEISHAYDVLSDADKRRKYDQFGEEGLEGDAGHDPNDIFAQFFGGGGGGRRGGNRRPRGEDITHQMEVPLEQFYNGATRKISIKRQVIDQSVGVRECQTCDGHGVVIQEARIGPMIQRMQAACPKCRGQGSTARMKESKEILEVVIQPGAGDGTKIVFKSKADEHPGADTGDVVIVLKARKHDDFERKGMDLFVRRRIALIEALTGFEIPIEHLDGRKLVIKSRSVTKPVGVADGNSPQIALKAVRGEGMPSVGNPFVKGNLFLLLAIEFPDEVSASTAAALRGLLPPPLHPVVHMEDDATTEHHFVSDIDPRTSAEENRHKSGGAKEAYDEEEDNGHSHGAQRVGCATQ